MKPARIVFPAFCFENHSLQEAKSLARMGVGGFYLRGGTAAQTRAFVEDMRSASPYDHLLFCADIKEDLSEVVLDAPQLPSNYSLGQAKDYDGAYKKGHVLALQARSVGIDWLLAPVVDLGHTSAAFSENPLDVCRLAGDFVAGLSNGGALNCIKYFPGLSGALKTLAQLEDAEFMPYKSLFRRADAIMPSDMVFANIDEEYPAMLSDKILKGLLKKRLNYKGCVISPPLFKSPIQYEEASALKMLYCGVENILAPKNPLSVISAIEKEANKGLLIDEIIHAVSNHELFISKVLSAREPLPVEQAFSLCDCSKK